VNETRKQFYFNFWLDLFFVTMSKPKKRKAFSVQEKLGLQAPSASNTTVKNMKDTETCYAQCSSFSGQRKNLKLFV
jgi:hypothetical protein